MKFCERPFKNVYCKDAGEVWPCSWMHYPIGNLYQQDLLELWNSEETRKARETIFNGSFAYCRKQSCPYCERGDLPDLTEEEIRKFAVPSEYPENIFIANDKTCNIACTNCRKEVFHSDPEERKNIRTALNHLLPACNQAKFVNVNGRGEFLANPSYLEFLEKLSPVREDFHLGIESNGTLFDEAHWSRFAHLSKYSIGVNITLNSLRREVYQYLSGGFDYLERVIQNLHFLSELRQANQINGLSLVMVVQETNFWEIPEYIRMFSQSKEFHVDTIRMMPVYNWWGMERETYWFKNILNPSHPYHQAYLKILADDCWKNPKVYDWGCHNLREPRLHPVYQEKRLSDLMLKIYNNNQGLSPVDYIRKCLEKVEAKRIGVYGENEHYDTLIRLLCKAGAEIVFRLTRYDDAEGDPPVISMPHFDPDSVDTVLLLELFDQQNRTNNLRQLKFKGKIINLEELIEAGAV